MRSFSLHYILSTVLVLASCTSATTSLTPVAPGPFKGRFALLYQGGRGGATEPCGCHSTPYGGIDREYNAVKEARKQTPSTLFVDSGNALGPEKHAAPIETYRRKALALVEMLNANTLQVLSPGPWDLALGLPFLREAQKKAKFAFVNSSLKGKDGKPLFDTHFIADLNGFKVTVLGISPESNTAEWTSPAPEKALAEALTEVKGKGDWIVVLSQLPHLQNEKLAEKFPEVQIIVGNDTSSTIEQPYYFGKSKTLLLDPHIFGYHLGRLEAKVKLPFTGFYSTTTLIQNNEELAGWKKLVAEKKRVTQAKANIERIESTKQLKAVPGGTEIWHELAGLNKEDYGQPNEVTELLKKYNASLRDQALGK